MAVRIGFCLRLQQSTSTVLGTHTGGRREAETLLVTVWGSGARLVWSSFGHSRGESPIPVHRPRLRTSVRARIARSLAQMIRGRLSVSVSAIVV